MKSAADLISWCEAFALKGYHASSISLTRRPAQGWSLSIVFADFLAFGTPNAELSEVPEFGEDSVPGGYFIPGVHRAGAIAGLPGVRLSGFERVPDYLLALDWPPESTELAEAIIAELAGKSAAIDWAIFKREDGQLALLTKPGRWLVGMPAKIHAAAVAKKKGGK